MEEQLKLYLTDVAVDDVMNDYKKSEGNIISLLQIYMRTYQWTFVEALMCSIPKIPSLKKIVKKNFESLIMSAIFNEKTLSYLYDFYTDLKFGKNELFLEREIIISLCRHTFLFPNNKDIVIEFIKNQDLNSIVNYDSVLYYIGDAKIMEKHFGFSEREKLNNLSHCINLGSIEIMNKLIEIYKISKNSIVKMSLPIFQKNIQNYDIYDKLFIKDLVSEIATYSKTLWLPFIFENYVAKNSFTNREWSVFSKYLYENCYTLPFIQTLIYYMEKYSVDISKIFNDNEKQLQTSEKIIEYLSSKNITNFNFKIENIIKLKSLYEISNLFECYRCNNFSPIFYHIYSNLCHKNERFIPELNYAETLELGWSDDIKIQYTLFKRFCESYIRQINTVDKIILEYNTFLSFKYIVNDFFGLRLITTINNLVKKVTLKNIQAMHKQLFENIQTTHTIYFEAVKEKVLPLEDRTQSWILPENPRFIDYIADLYLYSELREAEWNTIISRLYVWILNKEKNEIIAKLVSRATEHCINIDKIVELLRKFDYINF